MDAHVVLTAASPEPESRAHGVPHQVQLKFVVPAVADPRTDVAVLAPSGRDLADGATTVTDLGVGQELATSAETGWYAVRYRVVLWGGHVDEGRYRFFVESTDGGGHAMLWAGLGGGLLGAALLALHVIGSDRTRWTSHRPRP